MVEEALVNTTPRSYQKTKKRGFLRILIVEVTRFLFDLLPPCLTMSIVDQQQSRRFYRLFYRFRNINALATFHRDVILFSIFSSLCPEMLVVNFVDALVFCITKANREDREFGSLTIYEYTISCRFSPNWGMKVFEFRKITCNTAYCSEPRAVIKAKDDAPPQLLRIFVKNQCLP